MTPTCLHNTVMSRVTLTLIYIDIALHHQVHHTKIAQDRDSSNECMVRSSYNLFTFSQYYDV